jgi:tetratricopeptide (TPR) repeat protein
MVGARAHFDAAIEADPNFALAYVYRAFAAPAPQRADRMHTAAEHAGHATADERALIEALQAILDDPEAGLDAANATFARFPDDAHVQYMAGVLNFQADRHDQAAAALERAIAAEPNMGGAHNILGYVRLEQGDHAGAEAALREYIRINPGHPNPYDSLGELYMTTGRYDEAIAQFEMALARDPEFTVSANNIVRVHIERTDAAYEQAIARGDAEALGQMHTPGSALLPPGRPPVFGRAAIIEFWRGGLASGGVTLDLDTEEVIVRDDMAFEGGTYTFAFGGESEEGKYTSLWLRGEDGVWRIHRDMWSSNSTPDAHD